MNFFDVRFRVGTNPHAKENLAQQKSPARQLGALRPRFFSRKAAASAALEGSLAYG
jgi:hypothetical protein